VYLDKSNKHMFELSNRVRLINCRDYLISSPDEFTGFVLGILSQNHDIEKIFLDSVLSISCTDQGETVDMEAFEAVVTKLKKVSEKFGVDMELSVSLNGDRIPESLKENILVAL